MLIVDVYNVLHVTGVLPPSLAGPEVDDLASLIASSRFARQRTLLVCDGAGRSRTASGRQVLFAGPGNDADTLIEHLIARWRHGRSLTVVSNDRAVQRAATRVGSRALASDTFLELLAQDAPASRQHRSRSGSTGRAGASPPGASAGSGRSSPMRGTEVSWWLMEFGLADPLSPEQAGTPEYSDDTAPASHSTPGTSPPDPTNDELGNAPIADGSPSGRVSEHRGAHTSATRTAADQHEPHPGAKPTSKPGAKASPRPDPLRDPVLRDALRHWAEQLDPADLDMERWLRAFPPPRGVEPTPNDRRSSPARHHRPRR